MEIVVDRALNQQAAPTVAVLAHIETDPKYRGIESSLQIGIGKDDVGIFATKFEADLLQVGARGGNDNFLDLGGSGECIHIDVRDRTNPHPNRIAVAAEDI